MALVLADRVQQTGTANTTVSFTLSGSVTGFQSFAVVGNTNTTYYSAFDASGNWEVGLGTYSTTGPTLTRTTILTSSNSNAAVTFSGTVNVFVTYPSGKSVNLDASGNASTLGTIASGTWNGSTIGVAYGGTGITTTPTNGQIPIGNGTNYTAATLTAGTGTSITNASGSITINATGSTLNSQTTGYTLVAGDAGKAISITTGGVTVPASVLSAGNIVTIYNNSASSQTITQGASLTLQWAGQTASTTGNRTLGLYGIATILYITSTNAVISGAGVT